MTQTEAAASQSSAMKPIVAKKDSFWRKARKSRALTLMLIPGVIILLINHYLPMFGVFIAFKDINYRDGIWGSPWIGFENFEFLFASPDSLRIAKITILYGLTFMAVNLILCVAVALFMSELRNKRLAKLYQTLLIMPNFLSMIVVSFIVYAFLDTANGYMNTTILNWLQLEPVTWYITPEYWPYILTIVNAWKGVGIGAVIYIAAIAGIDPEYYEAAVIDGATKWQQAMKITVPMIRPVIVIISILSMGSLFSSDFGLFYQVTLNNGALYDVTQTVDVYVYNALTQLGDYGMAAAADLFKSIVGLILVLTTNWIVKRISSEEALF